MYLIFHRLQRVKLVILIFVFKIYVEKEGISNILIIFAADIIND